MTDADLLALYEKLYLHEIEMREKITARLQTPITLVVTLAGLFAYLLQRYDWIGAKFDAANTVFVFFATVAAIALILATYHISRVWVNNAYRFIPFADQTSEYRRQLVTTYAGFSNAPQLVEQQTQMYLSREYVESSSFNARVNDFRSNSLDIANQQIVLAATMVLIAFSVFQFGSLDGSRLRPVQEVTITKPVDVRFSR